eukprot:CAMPEP_0170546702 /NCGR_PEP_ID=MMETSP0211-20121228/5043_1 /TAXON_ID=311385 /ORGANISM="Pseudokeronopsis sp., Strain OXSARD2" /LENGTH=95 /DNA_ID=CAMNT_0010851293 /DNA_START=119 /DNA_END=406 /DNA_ORIENTATION=-
MEEKKKEYRDFQKRIMERNYQKRLEKAQSILNSRDAQEIKNQVLIKLGKGAMKSWQAIKQKKGDVDEKRAHLDTHSDYDFGNFLSVRNPPFSPSQ